MCNFKNKFMLIMITTVLTTPTFASSSFGVIYRIVNETPTEKKIQFPNKQQPIIVNPRPELRQPFEVDAFDLAWHQKKDFQRVEYYYWEYTPYTTKVSFNIIDEKKSTSKSCTFEVNAKSLGALGSTARLELTLGLNTGDSNCGIRKKKENGIQVVEIVIPPVVKEMKQIAPLCINSAELDASAEFRDYYSVVRSTANPICPGGNLKIKVKPHASFEEFVFNFKMPINGTKNVANFKIEHSVDFAGWPNTVVDNVKETPDSCTYNAEECSVSVMKLPDDRHPRKSLFFNSGAISQVKLINKGTEPLRFDTITQYLNR